MTNVKLKFDRVEREEAVFLCGVQDLEKRFCSLVD